VAHLFEEGGLYER